MMNLNFEEPPVGQTAFNDTKWRKWHKLFMNGETRHSIQSLIADVPLEDTADERICLKLGDALAAALPMVTFDTTRPHSVLAEVVGPGAINRVLKISRKLMFKAWAASGDTTSARSLSGYLSDVPKAIAGASPEERAELVITDEDFEPVHGLRADPGAPGPAPPAAGPVPTLAEGAGEAAQDAYALAVAARNARAEAVRIHQEAMAAHEEWTTAHPAHVGWLALLHYEDLVDSGGRASPAAQLMRVMPAMAAEGTRGDITLRDVANELQAQARKHAKVAPAEAVAPAQMAEIVAMFHVERPLPVHLVAFAPRSKERLVQASALQYENPRRHVASKPPATSSPPSRPLPRHQPPAR